MNTDYIYIMYNILLEMIGICLVISEIITNETYSY